MKKLLIIFILLSILVIGCTRIECRTDSDCVAATCCHADSCVPKENAPNCTGVFCSMECRPYTMDCGQGRCVCKNNICAAEID